MTLLDLKTFRSIVAITITILQDNFFYDEYSLKRFIKKFYKDIEAEYILFSDSIDSEIKEYLENDYLGRKDFTSYFVSLNIANALVDSLFFSEQELRLFDNILPKFIGVSHEANVEQGNKRARN